ncbi:L,D-transpeptidase [Streptomyces sp. NPDC046909]|uniref:L,D-transpeptidase n=1 Tax=Streptomyces sp. NPDC046909 TaxID=3155617 RepID=UPI0033FDAA1C
MVVRKRVALAASAALALGGLTAALTPAQAAPAGDTQAAAVSYYLKFDKGTNTNSKLYLIKKSGSTETKLASYRAGSGVITNPCATGQGWLPNGTYTIKAYHTKYNGSLIKGYAFQLSDKKCSNGTKRTELFIHSEMTKNGGQGTTEPTRWDGNSDYKSAGCIKLKPADIKSLYTKAKNVGFPTSLKVVS